MGDVDAIENSILGPITELLTDVSGLAGVLTVSFAMDWRMTLIAITVAPGIGLLTYVFGRKIRATFRVVRERAADLTATLHDGVSGIRVVRGFAREPLQQAKFERDAEQSFRWNMRIALIFSAMRPAIRTIVGTTTACIAAYGGYMLWRDRGLAHPAVTAGMLTTFLFYVRLLYAPILGLGRTYAMIQRALGAAERVFEVLDTKVDIEDAPDADELTQVRGEVEIDHVSFRYAEETPVLRDVSLVARPGEMIALVGPSGAGKSTLANLIPRFYDVGDGRVLVDGHDVRSVKQRSLRKHIGMVLQETFLFNDTVRANIAYGKADATEEEIVAAARAANAHDFIAEMPNGYDTEIGERGVKLSGGEKQRLSIARAILSDPRILILDEATSSVDTETEMLIQKAIERLVKDRTTFCIAHRLSTVHRADEIIVMDEGRVVERGTHPELVKRGGLYKKLYERQFAAALSPAPEMEPPEGLGPAPEEEGAVDLEPVDDVMP
jgi:subfamily B ATP-binding cassette protein MsbA